MTTAGAAPVVGDQHGQRARRERGRRAAVAGGWCLAAVAVAAPVAAVLLSRGDALGWKAVLAPWLLAVPGVLVATGQPWNPLGWLMLSVAALFGGTAAASALLTSGLASGAAAWAVWFSDRASATIVPLTLLLLLLLPDGRLPSPAWRLPAALAVAVQLAVVLAWSLGSGPAAAPDTDVPAARELANPVAVLPARAAEVAASLEPLLQGLLLLALPAIGWRVLRGPGEDRRRLAPVLGATVVFVVLVVLGRVVWPRGADLLDVAACALLTAALTAAVVRRRLPGVDVVVGHAVVYSLLTASVAMAYLLAVGALGRVGAELPVVAGGVTAAAVALALLPLHRALQTAVHRLMVGDTRNPALAVRRLVRTSRGAADPEDVIAALGRTMCTSLKAAAVEVEAAGHPASSAPDRRALGERVTVDLPTQVADGGRLLVVYPPGRRVSRRDRAVVRDLADHVAQVVDLLHLAEEVRASRGRIVTAREEERLRLRRDLHDELGPTLAGLSMQLAGLGDLFERDPMTARERVGRLEAASRAGLERVRALSRELRPPELDELGLLPALGQVADRCRVRLVVRSGVVPPLSAAVEVALYRIAAEALCNVARHSGSDVAELTLTRDGGGLRLCVVDHGCGRGKGAPGVGTVSMRERADELGGTVETRETPGGGTTVEARLPLPGPEEVR